MLTEAAILALIVNPSCGAVRLPEQADLARHLVATALQESGGDEFIIGVNADPARHLPIGRVHAPTAAEAAAQARVLLAQGRSIDLGLFQINAFQLGRHHLTIETVFDACRNAAAGAEHLAGDYAWVLAHRLYNSGSTDHGVAYAQSVTVRLNTAALTSAAGSTGPPTEQVEIEDRPAEPIGETNFGDLAQ